MRDLANIPDLKAYHEASQALKERLVKQFGKKRVEGLSMVVDPAVDNAQYDVDTNRMSFNPVLLRRLTVEAFAEVVGHEFSHKLLEHALDPRRIRKGQRKINECVSDHFGGYFGYGGEAIGGFFAALPGRGRGWFVATHPDHEHRAEMLDNKEVMSKIPGTVSFGPSCKVVRVAEIQDKTTPVAYYTARMKDGGLGSSVFGFLRSEVRIHGLFDLNDDDPQVKPVDYASHTDTIVIDLKGVRFHPNGVGRGSKPPLMLPDAQLREQLGEEALNAVKAVRAQLFAGQHELADYLGHYSGAPTALHLLHQKLAEEQRQLEAKGRQ